MPDEAQRKEYERQRMERLRAEYQRQRATPQGPQYDPARDWMRPTGAFDPSPTTEDFTDEPATGALPAGQLSGAPAEFVRRTEEVQAAVSRPQPAPGEGLVGLAAQPIKMLDYAVQQAVAPLMAGGQMVSEAVDRAAEDPSGLGGAFATGTKQITDIPGNVMRPIGEAYQARADKVGESQAMLEFEGIFAVLPGAKLAKPIAKGVGRGLARGTRATFKPLAESVGKSVLKPHDATLTRMRAAVPDKPLKPKPEGFADFDPAASAKIREMGEELSGKPPSDFSLVEDLGHPREPPPGSAWRGPPAAPNTTDIPTRLVAGEDIAKASQNVVNSIGEGKTPIRLGRVSRAMRAIFKDQNVIRTRDPNDVWVLPYEVGRVIEKDVVGDITKTTRGRPTMRAELMRMGREVYGDRRPKGGYQRAGLAEFYRRWVSDEAQAFLDAPDTHAWFRDELLPANPGLADTTEKLGTLMYRWQEQGPRARTWSSIKTGAPSVYERVTGFAQKARGKALNYAAVFDDITGAHLMEKVLAGHVSEIGPYATLRQVVRSSGKRVEEYVMQGTLDGEVGRGIPQILEPVRRGTFRRSVDPDFEIYAKGRNAQDYKARGLNPDMSDAQIADAMSLENAEFKGVYDELSEWNNRLLRKLEEVGGMSPGMADKLQELYPNYLPYIRKVAEDAKRGRGVSRDARASS